MGIQVPDDGIEVPEAIAHFARHVLLRDVIENRLVVFVDQYHPLAGRGVGLADQLAKTPGRRP